MDKEVPKASIQYWSSPEHPDPRLNVSEKPEEAGQLTLKEEAELIGKLAVEQEDAA